MTTSTANVTLGFVQEPNTRGTTGLVWSCLVTIFLCTWSIQRLDIITLDSDVLLFKRKVSWLLMTLFCPEYVTWIAFNEWRTAKRTTRIMKEFGYEWWNLLHGFYAIMGGFVVRLNAEPRFQVSADGVATVLHNGVHYIIRSEDIQMLVGKRIIEVPVIEPKSLEERSKIDGFAKAITTVQVIWFCIQTIARAAQRLPISTLKLSTLAFTWCSAATTYFWWSKPLDLRSYTVIRIAPEKEGEFLDVFDSLDFSPSEQEIVEKVSPKEFYASFLAMKNLRQKAVHLVWIGCIFNGIHVAAWNFSFPSAAEQMLWRICSLTACLSIIGQYAFLFVKNKASSWQ